MNQLIINIFVFFITEINFEIFMSSVIIVNLCATILLDWFNILLGF